MTLPTPRTLQADHRGIVAHRRRRSTPILHRLASRCLVGLRCSSSMDGERRTCGSGSFIDFAMTAVDGVRRSQRFEGEPPDPCAGFRPLVVAQRGKALTRRTSSASGAVNLVLPPTSCSRPAAMPTRSATVACRVQLDRQRPLRGGNLRRRRVPKSPIVSQIAARTCGSARSSTSHEEDRTDRGDRALRAPLSFQPAAAWPRASAAAARTSGSVCRSDGTMSPASAGRSSRPRARTAASAVSGSALRSPPRMTATSRGVGARRSSACRIANRPDAGVCAGAFVAQKSSASSGTAHRQHTRVLISTPVYHEPTTKGEKHVSTHGAVWSPPRIRASAPSDLADRRSRRRRSRRFVCDGARVSA